jgi:hypothetical protein
MDLGGLVDDVDHLLKGAIWHFLGKSPGRAGAAPIVFGEVEDLSGEKRKLEAIVFVERVVRSWKQEVQPAVLDFHQKPDEG